MIVDMKYIKNLNIGYHNFKSYSEIYGFGEHYACNKCNITKNKRNLICIHNFNKQIGQTYCLECIGGIKNIENFIISEFVLEKVLE